jgi:hypothetical protein
LADGRWEKLSSEKILETPYFTLRTDKLRLPDGAVKDSYYVLERADAVFVFPLTKEGEVVLVRQYRPPLEKMELCLPAGPPRSRQARASGGDGSRRRKMDEGHHPLVLARTEEQLGARSPRGRRRGDLPPRPGRVRAAGGRQSSARKTQGPRVLRRNRQFERGRGDHGLPRKAGELDFFPEPLRQPRIESHSGAGKHRASALRARASAPPSRLSARFARRQVGRSALSFDDFGTKRTFEFVNWSGE